MKTLKSEASRLIEFKKILVEIISGALQEAYQRGIERGYNAGRDVTGEKTYEDGIREAADVIGIKCPKITGCKGGYCRLKKEVLSLLSPTTPKDKESK